MQEVKPYQHYCNRKEKRLFLVLDIHEPGIFSDAGKVILKELKEEATVVHAIPIPDFQHMIEKRQLEFYLPQL